MSLDYNEIRRIHRLEKSASKIVSLNEDFYNELNDFVSSERKTYLDSMNEFSSNTARDFANLKRMIEEVFSLREKKIITKALISSRTKEFSLDGFASQEKKLFEKILSLLNNHNELLSGMFVGNEKKKHRDLNTLSVRILSDIPSFVGTDMNDYGPFSKGQSVKLPYDVAKLLVKRELAEDMDGG